MEQIFIIEALIEKINLKIEKSDEELRQEEIYNKWLEDLAAASVKKGKKGKKGKAKKAKKGKKGKGKKEKVPAGPTEAEIKAYLSTCSVTIECLPLFNFYLSYDKFIPPPPELPPAKKGKKGKKGKGKGGGKKGKKGKKGKAKGPEPYKIVIPPDPIPIQPHYNVGQTVIFNSRPIRLLEIMKVTPLKISIWNREPDMNCVGFVIINWAECFFDTLKQAAEEYPLNLDNIYRDNKKRKILTTSVEITRALQCEEDLKSSGDVKIYLRLTCLGNKSVSNFVTLPEMPMIMGRTMLSDANHIKELEAERNWQCGTISEFLPVAYFYLAPEMVSDAMRIEEKEVHYEEYKAPFTDSELAIIAMGIPKGFCGGVNCPKRLEACGSKEKFIPSTPKKRGHFINANEVKGPCGRLDCPLASRVRDYIEKEMPYKPCTNPCDPEARY